MFIHDEYAQVAEFISEGFTGLDVEVTGWCAGYPRQELTLKGSIDVVTFLQECAGMKINGELFTVSSNVLLAAHTCEMQINGDISLNTERYLSEETRRKMHHATPWQKQAYLQCIEVLDSLWESAKHGWDDIADLIYEVSESGVVKTPACLDLPPTIKGIKINRKPINSDSIPISDYMDNNDKHLSDFYDNANKTKCAAELEIIITDINDEEITMDTDGAVIWDTDAELADIVTFFLKNEGYLPAMIKMEAA